MIKIISSFVLISLCLVGVHLVYLSSDKKIFWSIVSKVSIYATIALVLTSLFVFLF